MSLTSWDVARSVIELRRTKLPDPCEVGNVGSFFKNPVVSEELAKTLARQWPEMPQFQTADKQVADAVVRVKLSAGWLIDQCGWKGAVRGHVGVSPNHALVLINLGQGDGRQLMKLAREIQASVYEKFGVQLEPEPRII